MGRLVDDSVQCGYHGLVYDCTGACIHIPGQRRIPEGARVRSYPVVDRHGFTWIWMGAAKGADPRLIPDYSRLDDPSWSSTRIQFNLQCHYRLIVDNLLDLSHLAYVHGTTTGNDSVSEDAEVHVRRVGDTVEVRRRMWNVAAPPTFRRFAGYKGNMDAWQISRFSPPSYVRVGYGSAPAGDGIPEDDGFWSPGRWGFQVFHGITPETERTSYQFRYVAFSFSEADAATREEFQQECDQIISEDAAVFPIQQRAIDEDPNATSDDIGSTITIVHDGGLRHARRILAEHARAQQPGTLGPSRLGNRASGRSTKQPAEE